MLGAGSYWACGPGSGSLFSVSFSALDPTGPSAQAAVPQTLDFRFAGVMGQVIFSVTDELG